MSHARPLLRPPAIAKGDTIGVVSPSYAPKLGWLQRGVRALERAGFNVMLDQDVERRIDGPSTPSALSTRNS